MLRYSLFCTWCRKELIVLALIMTNIKAEYSHIWKCCMKGEYLYKNGRDCTSRDYSFVDVYGNIFNESTRELQLNRANDLYWLPPELWVKNLSVHYASTFSCDKFIVVSSNDEKLAFDENMNIGLQMPTITENEIEVVFEPSDYCIDAANTNGTWVVRICTDDLVKNASLTIEDQVKKCCPQGQLITQEQDNANCSDNSNLTTSGLSRVKKLNTDSKYIYNSFSLCTTGQFQIFKIPNITERQASIFLKETLFTVNRSYWRYMCLDVGVSPSGTGEWTLGYCSFQLPPLEILSAATYMSAPAAVLLALAVAVVVAQPQSRASTHCRAMACHAGALCVAHASHAVHAITQENCRVLAYIINFFLVAATAWLQVICFNLVQGFRNMLKSNVGDQKSGKKKKFLLYNIYGWGLPSIYTIIILSTESDYAFSMPLYHTKTCFFEDGPVSRTRRLHTLFYYYFWVGIILLLNIAMFVYTAVKIRAMRNETSILHRKEDGQNSANTRRSAVVYVKLLLVMGVLEMIVEVTAWALKNSDVPIIDGVRVTDKTIVNSIFLRREFTYRWIAHLVDLLRALAICVVCCFGEATRKKMRRLMARCLPRLAPPPKRHKEAAEKPAENPDPNNISPEKFHKRSFFTWQICKSCTRASEVPGTELQGAYSPRASVETITTSISSDSRSTSLT